jgi:hypothetical protein
MNEWSGRTYSLKVERVALLSTKMILSTVSTDLEPLEWKRWLVNLPLVNMCR